MKEATGRGRRAAAAGIVSGTVVAGVALFLLVNWLGSRHWSRGDWTKAKIYSLSQTTKKIVRGLHAPVQVTVFMVRSSSRIYPQVEELLNRYEALSPQIHVEEIDPARNPARAQQLLQQFNVQQNTVVFQSGSRKKYVTEDQIADFDFGSTPGQGGAIKAFKGEQAFTSAILAVTSAKSPKIYFSAGHGEKALDDMGEAGYSSVKDLLSKDNDTAATWNSLGQAQVPSDADLVVVAGPRAAFLAPEASALDAYLARGGHVLLMLDPVIPRPGAPPADLGLGKLLSGWGGRLDDDIVVDPGNALPFIGAETVYANHFGVHPIVDPLASAKMAVIFPLARSVSPATASHAGFTATALVQTTSDGWGETDLEHLTAVQKDSRDVPAPVTLAIAVSKSGGVQTGAQSPGDGARLVAIGDSDFASNASLQNVSDANFFLNAVHWLLGNESLVGIAPKTPEETHLTLTAAQMRRIGFLTLLILPGLAVAAGIFVWSRRRR